MSGRAQQLPTSDVPGIRLAVFCTSQLARAYGSFHHVTLQRLNAPGEATFR